MINGLCQYCLERKPLCEAHIIPKLYYKDLRDKDGQFPLIKNNFERQRVKYIGDFGYDTNILCEDCDKSFGKKFENYIGSLINDEGILSSNSHEFEYKIPISYKKLKLFLLLVLWRASISDRFMWSNVSLSFDKKDQIKEYLKNNSLVDPYFFPTVCIQLSHNKIKNRFFIAMPESYESPESNYFTFIFGGYMWVFFLEKKDYLNFSNYPLIKNTEILQIRKQNLDEIPFLSKTAKNKICRGKES